MPKKRVLFVCVQNSCRSQMAEGFARQIGGKDVEAYSAGSKPGWSTDPDAIALMLEKGIDISMQLPKRVDDLPGGNWDAVVTMGCGDACPSLPAKRRLDWEIADPRKMSVPEFRKVRDEIERRVRELLGVVAAV